MIGCCLKGFNILRQVLLITSLFWSASGLALDGCMPLELKDSTDPRPVSFSDSLLWRITAGTGVTSYLFGTIHLGDADIVRLRPAVNTAFSESKHFVMEVNPDNTNIRNLGQHFFSANSGSLQKNLSGEIYQELLNLLAAYGIEDGMVTRMQPWAAYLTLSGPLPSEPQALDLVLFSRARDDGKTVHGLESLEEQIAVFDVLTEAEQIRLVADVVCHNQTLKDDMAEMKQKYISQDVASLVGFTDKYIDTSGGSNDRLMTALLDDRNQRMLQRMRYHLQQGDAFIAVGALHLPGDKGLLALLKADGYHIESMRD